MVIRVKGVKRVVSKGRTYYYHRKSGQPLPGEPGTTAFMDRLAKLDAAVKPKADDATPGTLGSLFAAYRASPEFLRLSERTRKDYQKVFDYLKPVDARPVSQITTPDLFRMRDKVFAQRKRRFANYVIQVLSIAFNWGKPREHCPGNPAADVEPIKRPRNARDVNRPWTDEETEIVLAVADDQIRPAIALGKHLGIRQGDMLKVTWASYDGAEFAIRQGKTGELLWVRAHPELQAILDATPRRNAVIVTNRKGQPYTQTGFQTRFFKLIGELAKAGKVAPGLTFHGLRHTVGHNLAEAGCDDRTIAAVLGQKTVAMAQHYSKHASQREKARAGMARMESNGAKKRKAGGSGLENRPDGGTVSD